MDRSVWHSEVISLSGIGEIGKVLQKEGVTVRALNMGKGASSLIGMVRLVRMLRRNRPDIIQTWLYHADLIGGLAARMARVSRVVWNVRHSSVDEPGIKPSTRLIARFCGMLSRWVPIQIACNSSVAMKYHCERLGYREDKFQIIPNGFEINRFGKNPEAKRQLRMQLGISSEHPIVGMVARFHPQKDHLTLVKAAAGVRSVFPGVRFVLCGDQVDSGNKTLMGWLDEYDLIDTFHLLGRRDDILEIMAGFDVAVLSSAYGEGFPNVVGEAMASSVVCVVTDVGDSAYIVDNTGKVVPPRDVDALSSAIRGYLEIPECQRSALGEMARSRLLSQFDIRNIVKMYERMYGQAMTAN